MFRIEWLFLMQLGLGVLMLVFLRKLMQMKKQVDEITKEVTNYISYITEELEEEPVAEEFLEKKEQKTEKTVPKVTSKKEREMAQNQLIQAVLGEYFP